MRHLLLLALFCCSSAIFSQQLRGRIHYRVNLGDTTQTHQLILLDYSKLIGTATRLTSDTLYFRPHAALEEAAIPAFQVRYVGEYARADRFRRKNRDRPGLTDLTFERTALPFQSRGQLKIINGIYVGTEFNLNEYVQLGAGLAPLGLIVTQRARYSLHPKLHVGLSNQAAYFPLFGSFDGGSQGVIIGDLSAMATFGDENAFFNVGMGMFYNSDTENESILLPRAAVGVRISKFWHAYAEAILSLSERNERFRSLELYPSFNAAYGKRRHRWKFGLFTVVLDGQNIFPPPLPYVGYSLYW